MGGNRNDEGEGAWYFPPAAPPAPPGDEELKEIYDGRRPLPSRWVDRLDPSPYNWRELVEKRNQEAWEQKR